MVRDKTRNVYPVGPRTSFLSDIGLFPSSVTAPRRGVDSTSPQYTRRVSCTRFLVLDYSFAPRPHTSSTTSTLSQEGSVGRDEGQGGMREAEDLG